MNGQYPRFKNSYFYEELTENFLLTPAELEFVRNCRGDVNRQGMAILLKGLQYLGYFPESLEQVPGSIRSFMGKQLGLLTDFINQYPWETSTRERHLAQIREFTGWRSMTSQDKEEIEQWLRQDGALSAPSGEKLIGSCPDSRTSESTVPTRSARIVAYSRWQNWSAKRSRRA
jgi:hypothetical protein